MSTPLQVLCDALTEGVILVGAAGQVEFINLAACRMLQTQAGAVLEKPSASVLADTLGGLGGNPSRLLSEGGTVLCDGPDGTRAAIAVRYLPLPAAAPGGQAPVRGAVVLRDVRDERGGGPDGPGPPTPRTRDRQPMAKRAGSYDFRVFSDHETSLGRLHQNIAWAEREHERLGVVLVRASKRSIPHEVARWVAPPRDGAPQIGLLDPRDAEDEPVMGWSGDHHWFLLVLYGAGMAEARSRAVQAHNRLAAGIGADAVVVGTATWRAGETFGSTTAVGRSLLERAHASCLEQERRSMAPNWNAAGAA